MDAVEATAVQHQSVCIDRQKGKKKEEEEEANVGERGAIIEPLGSSRRSSPNKSNYDLRTVCSRR